MFEVSIKDTEPKLSQPKNTQLIKKKLGMKKEIIQTPEHIKIGDKSSVIQDTDDARLKAFIDYVKNREKNINFRLNEGRKYKESRDLEEEKKTKFSMNESESKRYTKRRFNSNSKKQDSIKRKVLSKEKIFEEQGEHEKKQKKLKDDQPKTIKPRIGDMDKKTKDMKQKINNDKNEIKNIMPKIEDMENKTRDMKQRTNTKENNTKKSILKSFIAELVRQPAKDEKNVFSEDVKQKKTARKDLNDEEIVNRMLGKKEKREK